MKKIFFMVLVCGAVYTASAQNDSTTTTTTTTTTTHKYYYYPSSNVYFDEASGDYWYWDKPSSAWSMTKTLPTTVTLVETQKYPIQYSGNDPWKNNATDIKKYKSKDGKEKIKSDDQKVKTKDK